MRYLTPDFIQAYERAGREERKRLLRSIIEVWDAEYQKLISCGVSPDTIWYAGTRQMGEIVGNGRDGQYN